MSSYDCCFPDKKEFKKIISLASLLKLISEESRLKILCVLQQDKHCVCEMADYFKMSQSLISHHLADLKKAGLAEDKRKGKRVYYSLTKKGKEITNLIFNFSK